MRRTADGLMPVLLVVAIGFLVLSRRWDYGRLNLGKYTTTLAV